MIKDIISEIKTVEDVYVPNEMSHRWIERLSNDERMEVSKREAAVEILKKSQSPLPIGKPYSSSGPFVELYGANTVLQELQLLL